MARIRIAAYLPFVSVIIHANGRKLPLQRVLLDTGAARTSFRVGDLIVSPHLGSVNYGFQMNGILGLDFLLQTGAVIDFKALELRKG